MSQKIKIYFFTITLLHLKKFTYQITLVLENELYYKL